MPVATRPPTVSAWPLRRRNESDWPPPLWLIVVQVITEESAICSSAASTMPEALPFHAVEDRRMSPGMEVTPLGFASTSLPVPPRVVTPA